MNNHTTSLEQLKAKIESLKMEKIENHCSIHPSYVKECKSCYIFNHVASTYRLLNARIDKLLEELYDQQPQ